MLCESSLNFNKLYQMLKNSTVIKNLQCDFTQQSKDMILKNVECQRIIIELLIVTHNP